MRAGLLQRLPARLVKTSPSCSIFGAVWCHWCHVMDRESYEDPSLAEVINLHFIAVKVDRDERPDVDTRYQAAVAAISGQNGWPLTAVLTPEGKPFFGGTYFPGTTVTAGLALPGFCSPWRTPGRHAARR